VYLETSFQCFLALSVPQNLLPGVWWGREGLRPSLQMYLHLQVGSWYQHVVRASHCSGLCLAGLSRIRPGLGHQREVLLALLLASLGLSVNPLVTLGILASDVILGCTSLGQSRQFPSQQLHAEVLSSYTCI
jgi:hypothetical protein